MGVFLALGCREVGDCAAMSGCVAPAVTFSYQTALRCVIFCAGSGAPSVVSYVLVGEINPAGRDKVACRMKSQSIMHPKDPSQSTVDPSLTEPSPSNN